jgi:MoaA/NifB/PqqE/SkfB family radical SAM enzyme
MSSNAGGCMAAGRGFFHINPHGGARSLPVFAGFGSSLKDVSLLDALDSPLFVRLRSSELLAEHHDGACALFGARTKCSV